MKTAAPILQIELLGSQGTIVVGDEWARLELLTETGLATSPITPHGTMGGMQAAVADLLSSLEHGTPTQSPAREARKAVAIIEGILESQASGNCRVDIG